MKQIVDLEKQISRGRTRSPRGPLGKGKKTDSRISSWHICQPYGNEQTVKTRKSLGIIPVYKLVDTCAAEFRAATPYYYSTYETECEARVSDKEKSHYPGRRAQPDRPGH